MLLLVNGNVVGAVDLREGVMDRIEGVPDWAGFIAELIGKYPNSVLSLPEWLLSIYPLENLRRADFVID